MTEQATETKEFRKKDLLLIPPEKISIIEGFNPEGRCDDVSDIYDSIKENGVIEPLQGFRKNGKIFILSGHRRFFCVMKLIEAKEWKHGDLKFIPKPEPTPEERNFDIINHNTGKRLEGYMIAEVIDRLLKAGIKQPEIARRIGKTQAYVSQMHKLVSISEFLKQCLREKKITTHFVIQLTDKYKEEAEQTEVVKKLIAEKTDEQGDPEESGKPLKIKATEIPRKVGRPTTKDVKRQSKYHRIFSQGIEFMKQDPKKYTPIKVKKFQTIMKALDAKTPQNLVNIIMEVL